MKIKIPVTWVEYKKGELVLEVPNDANIEDIIEEVEKNGVDVIAFCDTDYNSTLITDEEKTEYGEYAIADKNNIIIKK